MRTLGAEHDLTVATRHLRDALDEGLDPEIGLIAPSVLESRHTRLAREGRSLVWSAVLRTSRAVEAETWALLRPQRAVIEQVGGRTGHRGHPRRPAPRRGDGGGGTDAASGRGGGAGDGVSECASGGTGLPPSRGAGFP